MQMFIKTAEYFVEQGKRKEAVSEVQRAIGIIEILKDGEEVKNLELYENYLRNMEENLKSM